MISFSHVETNNKYEYIKEHKIIENIGGRT